MSVATRTFSALHGELFLSAMSDLSVAAYIQRAENALRDDDEARLAPNPYTVATPIVMACMHAGALRQGPRVQWIGFSPALTLHQLLTMTWALGSTEAALLGMAWYLTGDRRRNVLVDREIELHLLAERSIQVAVAVGWDPRSSRFSPQLLIPPDLRPAHEEQA
ncbi:MAG: hypothetical protein BGO38_01295 [Cellulomonas sp. 73-145]|uniref:hypothetical protein n=1 Tax=Cellulomonas sp. 73-145 TaxID=1895739 RepID=UPI0009276816|nr:hypothetical protein [Cellulomonas sp. 73-145]MBN9325305.1 hypothetical protein [Cellulomonas sp.]OJV60323.1 MAG: hypothetical protein BGO38_01295 [Cellulomonas sp. 73-145]